jgi:hypothetical protein
VTAVMALGSEVELWEGNHVRQMDSTLPSSE